ncbi:MAG: hypothetical protein EBR09_10370 [Proteobacteria bacterium]|nr:hypothetical protein [Pseudomonadota bacterium]
MIVNTGIKYRNLIRAGICTVVIGLCAPACKSLLSRFSDDQNSPELQKFLENAGDGSGRTALLSLTADDYQGLSSRGSPLQWQPVLMPLRSGLVLTDRQFALGTSGALGNIEGRLPDLGRCQPLASSSTPSDDSLRPQDAGVKVSLELADESGNRAGGSGGQLFLVHDQISRFVRAVGFWDESAQATCNLPAGRWFLSTGFGEARSHIPFVVSPNRENKVLLKALPRARVIVRLGRETGLEFGDILRIGRIRTPQPAAQTPDELPEVPLLIQDDLIRPVMTPSENNGVREYLFTSILLHRPEFTMPLEAGEYSISLWRDGIMKRCNTRVLIQPSDVAVLACDSEKTGNATETFSQQENRSLIFSDSNARSIVFDGTFLPSRMINNSSLRAWLAKNGVNRFLRAGRTVENQQFQQLQFILQPLLQAVQAERIIPPEGPFVGNFSLSQKAESDEKTSRAPFARLLYAQSGLNLDSLLSRVFKPLFAGTLPLAGISERGLLEGVVPLTFRTTIRTTEVNKLRSEETETYVSNGAQIEWIEPLPAASGYPMRLGPQQRVRVRLRVPPDDTTEYFSMFINGERYKQWSVPLSQYRNMTRTLEIDEKITLTTDFLIGFSSWGKTYLPEYMFGVRQLPAVGFTRIYCIDANENALCDRQ